MAKKIEDDYGKIDVLVHSLANGPEVKNPLLETSRSGYLAALSMSSYSYVSLVQVCSLLGVLYSFIFKTCIHVYVYIIKQ